MRSVAFVAVAALSIAACGGESETSQASEAEVCDSLTELQAAFEGGDELDPTEAVDTLLAKLQAFVDVAPEEVKGDAETLVEGSNKIKEQLTGDDGPSEEDLAFIEDEKYDKASDKLSEYAKKTCDIEIG